MMLLVYKLLPKLLGAFKVLINLAQSTLAKSDLCQHTTHLGFFVLWLKLLTLSGMPCPPFLTLARWNLFKTPSPDSSTFFLPLQSLFAIPDRLCTS